MTKPLDPLVIQRLAFIGYLYEQGVEQAKKSEPLSATAVLSFHDAVELFLRLAAEHLKINLPAHVNFAEYWDKLQPGLPPQAQLPSKNSMERVNKLRVAFKHNGTIPSSTAIEQARGDVTTFFTDACLLVFGVDFAQIDLIDMVARAETVQRLRDAQTHADVGVYLAAMVGLVIAFEELVDHYSERTHSYSNDPLSFGPTLQQFSAHGYPKLDEQKSLEDLTQAGMAMQRALRLLALGIDYRSYAQFAAMTPEVNRYFGGRTTYRAMRAQANPTAEEYRTCRLFVIEAALQAAKADSFLEVKTRHKTINNPEPGVWESAVSGEWTGPA